MPEQIQCNVDEPPQGLQNTKDLLAPFLPSGEQFQLVHVRSPPQKCRKLVFTATSDRRLDTMTVHYFVLAHKETALVSLEVYTFEAPDTFTIFVSKADTTGFYTGPGRLNTMETIRTFLRSVFRFYSPRGKRVRICLFAKAGGQYLFLGSIKNPLKHVLSDAQLVKWWIKCLDGIHEECEFPLQRGKCTLSIPGLSHAADTATYFPPQPKLPWTVGDIFWEGDKGAEGDADSLAVRRIPRFPDDPKSRFLDTIVSERRAKRVSRIQFWLELQSRQEFLLGKSVGIIGLETWLKSSLSSPCFKEPTVTKRECTRFKNLLLDLCFDTLENTNAATARLLSSIPDICKVAFEGRAVPESLILASAKRKAESNEDARKPVNMLNTSIVRKKQKQA